MPTKQDYMEIINEKLSKRPESQEKSGKASVGGTGSGSGESVDLHSTEEYE